MNHSSSTRLSRLLIKLLFHCVVGIYSHGLLYIRFRLLRDKNQVLFISVSAVPSTVLRKQRMLNKGLLMGRRKETVSERKIKETFKEKTGVWHINYQEVGDSLCWRKGNNMQPQCHVFPATYWKGTENYILN